MKTLVYPSRSRQCYTICNFMIQSTVRLRKCVWKLRWWAALRYLLKLFISVRILGIKHQKLTRIGLPRLRWYVTVSEGPVSVPFSVSLELQFADDLKSLHRSWNYYLCKINWWNTSPNISISVISRRFPHSSITFGLMNYFNWFIYYHVTALKGRRTP